MNSDSIVIHTRFIVRDEAGDLTISGFPGIALEYFAISKQRGFDEASEWYQRVVSQDTFVVVSLSESIRDLRLMALSSLGVDPAVDSIKITERLFLGTKHEFAWIEDESLSVDKAIEYFSSREDVFAFIKLNNSAGEVLRGLDEGIRYFIHPNEQGHNIPHVHVNYKNSHHASVSIINGEVTTGILPGKALRRARKRILENRERLLDYWNAYTNGVKFDINYLFAHQ